MRLATLPLMTAVQIEPGAPAEPRPLGRDEEDTGGEQECGAEEAHAPKDRQPAARTGRS